ncbi:hypothetical protein ACF08B_19420 [Streptomyces sp. NPDC015139]|uniref:hypothetical protein n=1 Tax=Streptomyces sp. NPDC015139 TaxID=3364942 RepID=UPI0036F69BFB
MAALGTLLATTTACGGPGSGADGASGAGGRGTQRPTGDATHPSDTTRVPGVGERLHRKIPADSSQVVAVYGRGKDSAESTVVLYTRRGGRWHQEASWPAHNGRKGWTTDHHEGDKRSPVGVFTLSDAGGVLPDPGAKLPYDRDQVAYAAPAYWKKAYHHDFDYVIAIDYNRVRGNPPKDATRPLGAEKGGSIWLHMDHHSGTSACVSVSRAAMEHLLRTLDPARKPVVVMGDRVDLSA